MSATPTGMSTLARGMSPRTSSRARLGAAASAADGSRAVRHRPKQLPADTRHVLPEGVKLSEGGTIIEYMFESMELAATGESAALIELACDAARTEAQATGRRLKVIADLMQLRYRQHGERAEWVADVWDAIAAETGRRSFGSAARWPRGT